MTTDKEFRKIEEQIVLEIMKEHFSYSYVLELVRKAKQQAVKNFCDDLYFSGFDTILLAKKLKYKKDMINEFQKIWDLFMKKKKTYGVEK